MVLIYVKSGEWMCSRGDDWSFVVDKEMRGRMVTLATTTTLKQLKITVCEDYGVDHNAINAEFSYSLLNQKGNPPIIITNNRQASNFVGYAKRESSTTLCVMFSVSGVNQKERVNIDLNKEPCMEVHRFTDALYSTAAWRTAYADSINPIAVPES
uniref:Uncharacterized protein n=1 Tax=Brassica oleracea var. oleracea TaxID=109376 RepID=A0A0D3CG84_BRAOL